MLGRGSILSRRGVPFVPGTVPVCPGNRPAENVYVYQPSGPAEVQCEFFGPISGLNFGR